MSLKDFKGEAYAYDRLFKEKQPALAKQAHEDAMLAMWQNIIGIAFAGIVLALIVAVMRAR